MSKKSIIYCDICYNTKAYGKAKIKYTENGYLKEIVYNSVTIEGMGSSTKKLDDVKVFRVQKITLIHQALQKQLRN